MAVKSGFISFFRTLLWCFLTSIVLSAMEAMAYFMAPANGAPLSFTEFYQRFSITCAILLTSIVITWFFLWFFLVWLGNVRNGMALFFMITFFMLCGYLVILLDLLFMYTSKYDAHWALLMRYFISFALIGAVTGSLILGKISRRFLWMHVPLRAFLILSVWFLSLAFVVWRRYTFPEALDAVVFWSIYAGAVIAGAVLLWWLCKTPRRLVIIAVPLFIAVIAPFFVSLAVRPPIPPLAHSVPGGVVSIKRVIMITVDTLRRDAVGCYNPDVDYTPQMDRFAGDCTLFNNAFSSAPWTYPAVASILTGLAPAVHSLTDGKSALPENVPTMAEAMRNAGYHTAAIGFNGLLTARSKLDRGFQEYHWVPVQSVQVPNFDIGLTHNLLKACGSRKPDGAGLTDHAIQWLKKHSGQEFFLWLHYFDPHMPYTPPVPFQPTDPEMLARGTRFSETRAGRMGSTAKTAEERAWIRTLYEGEVAYVDAQLGRFLDTLKQLNLYEDSLILLTSDHGEELWDHGRFEHGHTLYNELIHVPLLVKLPGVQPQTRVDASVSTQAVAPTILELCGVQTQASESMSPSFSSLFDAQDQSFLEAPIFGGAPIFHEPLESVVFDRMKYVRSVLSGQEWLFNLAEDPEERNSLVYLDPASAVKGRQLLEAAREADERVITELGIQKSDADRLNPEDIRSLEALGYL